MLCKKQKYSFTAKGGHNDEMHNHNDLGCFQIVKNNKRVIVDIGAGEYTREFFGGGRYGDKVFVCGSQSHSVPIIDGALQKWGKATLILHTKTFWQGLTIFHLVG